MNATTAISLHSLHHQALATFPAPLAGLIRAHKYADEIADLAQEAALAMLAAPGASAATIYKRARSAVRRYTQNPAHYAAGGDTLDALSDGDTLDAAADVPRTRRQIRRQIEADLGLSTRDAQRLLKKQLERMQENGDLFAHDESGVTA